MQDEIIAMFVICDDFVQSAGHQDDHQSLMCTSEVMLVPLVASMFFKNCMERARIFLEQHGYIPNMLSASRLNRRIHQIPEALWQGLFTFLAKSHVNSRTSDDFIVDSIPIQIIDNYRIPRCKLYREHRKSFRGVIASKHRYFYGLRGHFVMTADGKPVEYVLAPASVSDIAGFKQLYLDLPDAATIYGDKAYTDYVMEDLLNQDTDHTLIAMRRSNSKRPLDASLTYICHHVRKRIETSFAIMANFFGKRIFAVTERGVELRAFCAGLALSFHMLWHVPTG
jgi:hypothetical protein